MESVVLRSNSGWGDLHIYEGSTLPALVLSPGERGGGPTRRAGTDIREDNLMPSLEDWLPLNCIHNYSNIIQPRRQGGVGEREVFSREPDGVQPPVHQVSTCSQIPRGLIIPNTNMDGPARLPPRGDTASEGELTNESRELSCPANHEPGCV